MTRPLISWLKKNASGFSSWGPESEYEPRLRNGNQANLPGKTLIRLDLNTNFFCIATHTNQGSSFISCHYMVRLISTILDLFCFVFSHGLSFVGLPGLEFSEFCLCHLGLVLGTTPSLSTGFWGRLTHWTRSSLIWLGWLANQLQKSTLLALSQHWIQDTCLNT